LDETCNLEAKMACHRPKKVHVDKCLHGQNNSFSNGWNKQADISFLCLLIKGLY